MEPRQLQFVNDVAGSETALAAFAEREIDRRAAYDTALSGLADKKDAIREGMQVRLVDAQGHKGRKALTGKGQEHDLDTFKATRKGQGLSKEDMQKAGMAMKPIVDAARALLESKTRDGKPLFETQEDFERALTEELFTPLVREGVLPENFVIDPYSEVQQLLNNTFASYKQRNADDRDDAERDNAKAKGKYHGSGSGMEQFGAMASRLASAPTRLADSMGIDKNMRRQAGIVKAGADALVSIAQMGTTLASWQMDTKSGKPRIETNFARQLDPSLAGYSQQDYPDPDEARSEMATAKRTEKIVRLGLPADVEKNILSLLAVRDDNNVASSEEGIGGYGGNVLEILSDIVLPAVQLQKVQEALGSAHNETAKVVAAQKAAIAIDKLLVGALDKHFRSAGKAVAGMYANAVDVDAVGEAAALTNPDDQAIIEEFGLGFERVFAQGLGLQADGKTVMAAFVRTAQGGALQKALKTDPAGAFAPLLGAADAMLGITLSQLGVESRKTVDAGVMKGLARTVAKQIDAEMVAALKAAAGASAAEAFAGLYAAEVDVRGIVDAALADPVDGAEVVRSLAGAFHSAMAQAAPDPSNTVFLDAGKKMAAALTSGTDAGKLGAALASDPAAAFIPVIAAAKTAIAAGLSDAGALAAALATPEAQRALAAKSAFPDDGEEAMAALEASDEELREYERQLVLVDEGGLAAAELSTIEGLIQKLERDRLIAEMIVASAGILTGMASSTTSIIGQQTAAVTDTLVGEIVGPLKAAKLIVKFAVAMKQANDRRILLQKFKKSLDLSRKAVSPMQSTLQGLFNNKVEQVTFRAIEDALTLIQIASAVLGSVPEPITQAVGKTLGAVATASEGVHKVTEMIYNEVMLAKAWSTTLAALRNPRDRVTGLAALKLNPTLGMHAIAWAGMEKMPPDPIARAVLSDLGLNEQTLAASGSEAKVRNYLETLLFEDRSLLDPKLISPDWIPRQLTLSSESWVVVVHRAMTLAEPPLRKSSEAALVNPFKRMDAQDVRSLEARAASGAIEPAEIEKHRADVASLITLLRGYRPVTSDGAEHDEMVGVTATFIKLAVERAAGIDAVAATNSQHQARDAGRVKTRAQAQVDALTVALQAGTLAALEPAFAEACLVTREIQIARMDENTAVKPTYQTLLKQAQAAGDALQALARPQPEDTAPPSGAPVRETEPA